MQDRPSALGRFLGRPPKALDWVALASVLTLVSLILACALCVVGPDLLSNGTTTTSGQAGSLATATAADTATPTAPPVKPPSIGAPYSAFAAVLTNQVDAQS